MSGGRFAPWTTAFYAAAWLAVVVQGWGSLLDDDPIARLRHPVASAERLTTRDLELAEALDRAPSLEKRVLSGLYGTREEILAGAIGVQEEVLAGLDPGDPAADDVRARLRVLFEESGRGPEAADRFGRDRAAELLAHSAWRTPDEARDLLAARAGLRDWYADVVLVREAPPATADAARSDLLARGEVWKRRSVALLAANLLLVVVGAALLATRVRFLRELLAGAGGGPPWSLADGLGVFVRGDLWNRLYFLVLTGLLEEPGAADFPGSALAGVLLSWGTLLGSLPLLWLVHRHLLAPAGRSAVRTFGLDARPGQVLRVALSATALDLLGVHAIAWTTWGLGVLSSWAEGFDETLAWGSTGEAFLLAADYVLWAPAVEELAFRGLLYYTLRHRLGPLPAAVLTAFFFAALHFYSLPGFLMTTWSGLVWALAFERLRSLLPGIGAHAVYNALFVAGLLLVYR